MSDGGKGSRPRPFAVDQKTFDSNWDVIFGKKKQTEGERQAEAFLRDEYYDLEKDDEDASES